VVTEMSGRVTCAQPHGHSNTSRRKESTKNLNTSSRVQSMQHALYTYLKINKIIQQIDETFHLLHNIHTKEYSNKLVILTTLTKALV